MLGFELQFAKRLNSHDGFWVDSFTVLESHPKP